MTTIYLRKLVNAFLTDASASGVAGAAAPGAADRYKQRHGGLWVGGTVTVTADAIDFVPNLLNKAVHTGLRSIHIPLDAVHSVRRVFGLVTGIVVVELEGAEFRFRCFNARGAAERIAGLLPQQAMRA